MKVLVTAKGESLDSQTDLRFGRAEYFLLIDDEKMKVLEATHNPNLNNEHGVGIQTSTFVLEKNPDVVLSGSFGPKAYEVIKEGKSKLYMLKEGTVIEAIEALKAGKLEEFKA